FQLTPSLPDYVRADCGDDRDSGVPALDVAAAAGVSVLGELPWRIFHGVRGAGHVLRGIVVVPFARETGCRRTAPVAGDCRLCAGGFPQPERVSDSLHSARVQPEQP